MRLSTVGGVIVQGFGAIVVTVVAIGVVIGGAGDHPARAGIAAGVVGGAALRGSPARSLRVVIGGRVSEARSRRGAVIAVTARYPQRVASSRTGEIMASEFTPPWRYPREGTFRVQHGSLRGHGIAHTAQALVIIARSSSAEMAPSASPEGEASSIFMVPSARLAVTSVGFAIAPIFAGRAGDALSLETIPKVDLTIGVTRAVPSSSRHRTASRGAHLGGAATVLATRVSAPSILTSSRHESHASWPGPVSLLSA